MGVVGGLNTTCLVSEVAKPLSSVNTRKNTSVHKGFSKKLENHRALPTVRLLTKDCVVVNITMT